MDRPQGREAFDLFLREVYDYCGENVELVNLLCGAHQWRKPKFLSDARMEVCARLREKGMSYPDIARLMGLKTHATSIYQMRRWKKKVDAAAMPAGK